MLAFIPGSSASPVFSSSGFKISCAILSSLICFELIFMEDESHGSGFILLCMDIPFSQNHWSQRLSPPCILADARVAMQSSF